MKYKVDPENGFLIGPSGCHYPNMHCLVQDELLHLCGCGEAETAFNLCRDVLVACDARRPFDAKSYPAQNVEKLIVEHPDAAAEVLMHIFTHFGLLEHGGSVGGSWTTATGNEVIDVGPATDESFAHEWKTSK